MEAINQVKPFFMEKHIKFDIYRMCIEKGIIRKEQLSPTTFYRLIREYDLLNDDVEDNKKRLAFAMEHALTCGRQTPCLGRMSPNTRQSSLRLSMTRQESYAMPSSFLMKPLIR